MVDVQEQDDDQATEIGLDDVDAELVEDLDVDEDAEQVKGGFTGGCPTF